MPKCIDCKWLNKDIPDCQAPGCTSPVRRVTLSRRCIFALLTQNLTMMGGKILEVGHGKVFFLRKRIWHIRGAKWHGLEPRWESDPERNKFRGTVSKMPFPDETFDCVVCSQCMEHWGEYRETIESGLKEIHRVLKPSGLYFADVPIHSHGQKIFVRGDMEGIRNGFDPKKWNIERFEEWRKEYSPLTPINPPLKYCQFARKYSNQNIPSEWLLNIVARKIGGV